MYIDETLLYVNWTNASLIPERFINIMRGEKKHNILTFLLPLQSFLL